MTSKPEKVTAFAPATSANLSVGFDILGLSLQGLGDLVSVERIPKRCVEIAGITGLAQDLPTDPRKNTAGLPLLHMIDDFDLDFGFKITIEKGIPVCSGLGGSAASAVASVVAANELLPAPLAKEDLICYSSIGECLASGSNHLDNVAPALLGGLILILENELRLNHMW